MSQAAAGPHSSRRDGTASSPPSPPNRPPTAPPPPPCAPTAVVGAAGGSRTWLALEWLALFAVLPTLIAFKLIPLHILLVLVIAGLGCIAWLLCDPTFDRRQLWNVRGAGRGVHRIIVTFVVLGVLMALGVAFLTPERLLHLVRERPEVWAMIMLGYPIVSVYPQEIIFRTFMFHRYRELFSDSRVMILMSAIAFGYAHIFFENEIAVIMTLIGGLLFAWTYDRTRSTFAVWLEHGLYGCFVFTIGLGIFFFSGAIGTV